eukprot:747745-Hanusia_phi.AAC.1
MHLFLVGVTFTLLPRYPSNRANKTRRDVCLYRPPSTRWTTIEEEQFHLNHPLQVYPIPAQRRHRQLGHQPEAFPASLQRVCGDPELDVGLACLVRHLLRVSSPHLAHVLTSSPQGSRQTVHHNLSTCCDDKTAKPSPPPPAATSAISATQDQETDSRRNDGDGPVRRVAAGAKRLAHLRGGRGFR